MRTNHHLRFLAYFFAVSAVVVAAPPDRDAVVPAQAERIVVEFERPLGDDDHRALSRAGARLVQPVGRQRAVVRADAEAVARLQAAGLVRDAAPIGPGERIHGSAVRAVVRSGASARLSVVFHEDVALGEAMDAIRAAGGWTVDPMPIRFAPPRNLEIVGSSVVLQQLARTDAVARILGDEGPIAADNRLAAQLSHVSEVHEAPYDLSGDGIIVSVLDVGNALASHREFEGRVIVHGEGSAGEHATHVTGTIAAKGITAAAKGMAPAVTLHQFSTVGRSSSDLMIHKDQKFGELGILADNNSWGFITGWDFNTEKNQHQWWGNEGFGAYSSTTAAADQIVRARDTLIFFSAGNHGNDRGPATAPFPHTHPFDADSEAIWCVAQTGVCPETPCGGRCETEIHPDDGPFGNMGRTASAKNAVGVGAVSFQTDVAGFSSRGPTRDGRIKPDLVAKGVAQFSTVNNGNYRGLQGTSMSTPVVTGIAALLAEQWSRTVGGAPGAAALKALLIHGARDLGNEGPDYTFGFGLVDAQASVDVIRADAATGARVRKGDLRAGGGVHYPVALTAGEPVRLTLVWLDPETVPFPQNETTLINDLDLSLAGPAGETVRAWILDPADVEAPATRGINHRDTVERIDFVPAASGTWKVVVRASAIPGGGTQPFVLVSSVDLGPAVDPCTDPFEPNDTAATAWGRLVSGGFLGAQLCPDDPADFYRFVVDLAGPVRVTVRATGTAPVRATLTAGSQGETRVVAAGTASTFERAHDAGVTEYLIGIAPEGALDAPATYSIETSYESSLPGRQRSARR